MWTDKYGNKWYKGNLHMHTTRSDGRRSYEDAVETYRQAGYDFIAVTDHWVYNEGEQQDDFLILSGCEYNLGRTVRDKIFHIVGFGMEHPIGLKLADDPSPQEVIDALVLAGTVDKALTDPAPAAVVLGYGESAMDYSLRIWVKSEDYWDVYFLVNQRVKQIFDEQGVIMTYPHLNIHLDK